AAGARDRLQRDREQVPGALARHVRDDGHGPLGAGRVRAPAAGLAAVAVVHRGDAGPGRPRRVVRGRLVAGDVPRDEASAGSVATDPIPVAARAAGAVLALDRRPARAAGGGGGRGAPRRSPHARVRRPAHAHEAVPDGAGVGGDRHARLRAGGSCDPRRHVGGLGARHARPPGGPHAREAPLAGGAARGGNAALVSAPLAGRQGRAGLMLALPSVALILVFFFGPVLYGLWLSLTDFDIYAIADPSTVRFVGPGNYLHAFAEADFWNALRVTLVYALVGAPISVAVSLAAALLVDAPTTRWKPFFRAVYFAPVVTTLVAVAIVWRYLYQPQYGLVNAFLGKLRIPGVDWLGDPHWALPAILVLAVWKNFGYNLLIFVAGLQNVPRELHEAAEL